MRQIGRAAGIQSGSLYHHFGTKDEIFETIVVEYLEDLAKRYSEKVVPESDPRNRLYHLILESYEVMHRHPHASEIYQDNRGYFEDEIRFGAVRELAASVHETWTDVVESGVAAGAFRSDINARVFHRFLRDAVFLASRWHRPTSEYGIEDLADDTARIFLDGFTASGEESR